MQNTTTVRHHRKAASQKRGVSRPYDFSIPGEVRTFLQEICTYKSGQITLGVLPRFCTRHGLIDRTTAIKEIRKRLSFYGNKPNQHQVDTNSVILLWHEIVSLCPPATSAHKGVRQNVLNLLEYAKHHHQCYAGAVPLAAQQGLFA